MTEGWTKGEGRLPLMAKSSLAVAAVVAIASIFGTTACDTVAQIPFSERNFRTVLPVGITSADSGNQCGGIESEATMSMVLLDDRDEPIKLGEEVARTFVDPERGDFDFTSGRIHTNIECTDSEDCPSGSMDCTEIDGVGSRCTLSSGYQASTEPRFVGTEPNSQAVAFLVSEEGRWRGWYDSELFRNYYVFDSTTGPNIPLTTGIHPEVATDPNRVRMNALKLVASDWANLDEYVREDDRRARFGLWTFGESRGNVGRVADQSASGSDWTRSSSTIESTIDEIDSIAASLQRGDRNNAYQAIIDALDDAYGPGSEVENYDERSLIVLVASNDERRQNDVEGAIEKAHELDVAVSIVHIDPARDTAPHLLRDDWRYYQDEPECISDDECANFESCRTPIAYTDEPNSTDESDIYRPTDPNATYCIPTYDNNGRLGPIADYDRLACETGGAYHYVPHDEEQMIYRPMAAQLLAPEAAWEVDFFIDEADNIAPDEAYFMQTNLEVRIDQQRTFRFEHEGTSQRDWRQPFFTPPAP